MFTLSSKAVFGGHHNKVGEEQPASKLKVNTLLCAVVAAFIVLPVAAHASGAGATLAILQTAPKAAPAKTSHAVAQDPFAGQTWHAVTPSWPGTIQFDGAKHTVKLTPLGAPEIEAKYTYTVESAKTGSNPKVLEGTLRMTNTAGQVSDSRFRIENAKNLAMTFPSGQRAETYVRMTPAEEAAEKARLEKMISEGRTKPLR